MADPLSRAPSLRDQPVEYLHDGLVMSLMDIPVSKTFSPSEILSSLDNNTMQQMLVGKQSDALAKQVYVFTLMNILSVSRGRTNIRKGGQIIALATDGRQTTRANLRNKQISEKITECYSRLSFE